MSSNFIKTYYALTTFVVLLSLYSYFQLDRIILDYMYHQWGNPTIPFGAIHTFSQIGKSVWYIVGSIIAYIIWRDRDPAIAKISAYILSTTILSGVAVNIIKVIFGRARPILYIEDHIYGFSWFSFDVVYRSFPSGHSTTAMAVATGLALVLPKYRIWFLALGIAIALSRVVLTEHYLSDVIVGGFLGLSSSMFLYHVFYRQEKRGNYEL